MANVNYTHKTVTKEDINNLGISLEMLLKNNDKCKAVMKWFHVSLKTIINIINSKNLHYNSFFAYKPYPCLNQISVGRGKWSFPRPRTTRTQEREVNIYVTNVDYDSIGWGRVAEELFKMKYPTLWKLFAYTETHKMVYEKGMTTHDFLFKNDLENKSIENVVKLFSQATKNDGNVDIEKNHIKIYVQSAAHEYVFFEVTDENSLYIEYEDLYECVHGGFDNVIEKIKNRCWYLGRVQGDETWFNSPKAIDLFNELKRLSDKFNIKHC